MTNCRYYPEPQSQFFKLNIDLEFFKLDSESRIFKSQSLIMRSPNYAIPIPNGKFVQINSDFQSRTRNLYLHSQIPTQNPEIKNFSSDPYPNPEFRIWSGSSRSLTRLRPRVRIFKNRTFYQFLKSTRFLILRKALHLNFDFNTRTCVWAAFEVV